MTIRGDRLSVFHILENTAQNNPEQVAIYDFTRSLTYGELLADVHTLASALTALGIQEGDRVAVSLPNWHEAVTLYFAIARIGAILVPFNPKYRAYEVGHILWNSGAKLAFVCEEFEQVDIDDIHAMVAQLVTVRYAKEGYSTLEELIQHARETALPTAPVTVNELYCILYTSGTTGMPKGVSITHRSVVQSGMELAETLRCTSEDIFLVVSPIFHVFGMACNLMSAVYCQAKMVLLDKYKAKDVLRLIEQEKVTIHHAVPSMLNLELKELETTVYDLSSLRAGMTGAATCPPEIVKEVREKMGMQFFISYGTTETGTVTLTEYDEEESNLLETVGKAVKGAEMKIVNDHRETLSYGQVGEIACKSFGVMQGYYKMPTQTEEVLDQEGWYYTGDLGTMDENGYVRIFGRKKDLIIRGGFNIYPQEIEGLLRNYPKVLESAVIGLSDTVMGEIVCAAIKLRPDVQASKEEIVDYLKVYVASYKLPSEIVFVQELPITGSGKILKSKLRADIMKKRGGEEAGNMLK